MPNSPMEFTPEIDQSYLDKLLRPINTQEDMRVGQAHSEALSRGLDGTPTETGGVAAERGYADTQRSDLRSDLAFKLAGLSREDRQITQQRDWQTGENAADRALKRDLGAGELEGLARQNDYSQKNALWQIPAGLASSAAGGFAGGYGAKLAMSDRRAKENIRRVGEDGVLGLPVYLWTYKPGMGQPIGLHVGFMADEVEAKYPAAVVVIDGLRHVDYGYLAGVR